MVQQGRDVSRTFSLEAIERRYTMTRKRSMLGVALAIALLLTGQGALATGRAHAARPAAGGSTLTIVMAHDAVGLDPQAVEDNSAGFVMATIFDQLLEYKPGTVNVGPGLATGYTKSHRR